MKVKVKLKNISPYSKGQQVNKEDIAYNAKYNYLNGKIRVKLTFIMLI